MDTPAVDGIVDDGLPPWADRERGPSAGEGGDRLGNGLLPSPYALLQRDRRRAPIDLPELLPSRDRGGRLRRRGIEGPSGRSSSHPGSERLSKRLRTRRSEEGAGRRRLQTFPADVQKLPPAGGENGGGGDRPTPGEGQRGHGQEKPGRLSNPCALGRDHRETLPGAGCQRDARGPGLHASSDRAGLREDSGSGERDRPGFQGPGGGGGDSRPLGAEGSGEGGRDRSRGRPLLALLRRQGRIGKP
ncbi:MAG: hypothetical protein BWY86_00802 [Candidatus Aminicenantes bacterium ADurb.Bin508]|nr:MAG: hypothetical protein BWY86_00802 [Candidatus Aminicenantes bacterium ADurb.Bin508]